MKINLLIAVIASMLLVGCIPLGMSEAEWNALTPEQKLAARQDQARIDEAQAKQRAEEARLKTAEKTAEQSKVNALYGNSTNNGNSGSYSRGYGQYDDRDNVSNITVYGGEIKVHIGSVFSTKTDWRKMGNTRESLAECEWRKISLPRDDKSQESNVWMTRQQGIVYINVDPDGSRAHLGNYAECGLPNRGSGVKQFSRGRYRLDVPNIVRGAKIDIN